MRLQTLTAVVLVAVVGTYLLVGRRDGALIRSDGGAFAALDALGTVDERGDGAGPSILVHVSGAVSWPGIIALPDGSRIADAIAAAGGATRAADLTAVNLAAPIGDGDQLVVPAHGDAITPERSDGGDEPGSGRVRLNTAAVADLMELPGIGPVLADRIVRHREQHGPFSVIEDLLDVAGIGEAKLLELRELVDL